jgi:hypothetical protein
MNDHVSSTRHNGKPLRIASTRDREPLSAKATQRWGKNQSVDVISRRLDMLQSYFEQAERKTALLPEEWDDEQSISDSINLSTLHQLRRQFTEGATCTPRKKG